MLFNSLRFILFFLIVVFMYYVLPKKMQKLWLLLCSYFFYCLWNPAYVILLLISTAVTYCAGALIEKINKPSEKKLVVAFAAIINFGMLGYFKYCQFFVDTVRMLFSRIGIDTSMPEFSIILPVGISFYIFQSFTYIIDIYRGDVESEKSIISYALFVSFFPNILSGPIEKSKHFLPQLKEDKTFDYNRMKSGALLMLWGYFLKVVVCDRMSLLVDTVFDNYKNYGGIVVIVAALFFSFQIYFDFAGYSALASGAAEILGFNLIRNFNQPYFADSVADFWRRWHISLSTWFKEYLYFPLGGSRKGKLKKSVNVLIVFLVSGLWHGASWHFVVWGIINGALQVLGGFIKPFKRCRVARIILTFILMTIAWVFFRASGIMPAILMIKSMVTGFDINAFTSGALLELALDIKDYIVVILSLIIVAAVDIANEKGYFVRKELMKKNICIQWLIYLIAIFAVLIFGVYGPEFITANFLYFKF